MFQNFLQSQLQFHELHLVLEARHRLETEAEQGLTARESFFDGFLSFELVGGDSI